MSGHTVFAYAIGGKGLFCDESGPFAYDVLGVNYFDLKRDRFIANGAALLFGDGDCVTASAEEEQLRFLLVSGKPIHEPIAWYGPIVMNAHDELRTAFDELDQGTFIKKPAG
jgi:quercetin 2,3-dioxygenase